MGTRRRPEPDRLTLGDTGCEFDAYLADPEALFDPIPLFTEGESLRIMALVNAGGKDAPFPGERMVVERDAHGNASAFAMTDEGGTLVRYEAAVGLVEGVNEPLFPIGHADSWLWGHTFERLEWEATTEERKRVHAMGRGLDVPDARADIGVGDVIVDDDDRRWRVVGTFNRDVRRDYGDVCELFYRTEGESGQQRTFSRELVRNAAYLRVERGPQTLADVRQEAKDAMARMESNQTRETPSRVLQQGGR